MYPWAVSDLFGPCIEVNKERTGVAYLSMSYRLNYANATVAGTTEILKKICSGQGVLCLNIGFIKTDFTRTRLSFENLH